MLMGWHKITHFSCSVGARKIVPWIKHLHVSGLVFIPAHPMVCHSCQELRRREYALNTVMRGPKLCLLNNN